MVFSPCPVIITYFSYIRTRQFLRNRGALFDKEACELRYRSEIVNPLLAGVFEMIERSIWLETGEIENEIQKMQRNDTCPYRDKLPSASWLNTFVIRAHNLNTSKRPKLLERMAATIDDELQLRREEIRQLQAQNPEVAITLIKCSRCLRDGHRAFECTDNNN